MSNEHHSPAPPHPANKEPRLIDLRFALRNILAKTALADVYWANDLHSTTTPDNPEKNLLVLLVTPALTHQQGFANAWQQILNRPAPPSAAYPAIIAHGDNNGEYWLALNHASGELLSERISDLDGRGLSMDSALDTLENINHVLSGIQAGPFGYLEPGAIQKTSSGYIILNAPLVKVQQQLTASSRNTANKFALHSGYISPSVAVGDAPVTEDDTFSSAALLYALLAGEAPYGERSTLTSVTHEYKPAPLKKLSKGSWEVLSSALAFQRKPRAENPDKLITALRKANKRSLLFPITIAASLGIMAFAVYHLTSKVGEIFQTPDTMQQQAQDVTQEPSAPLQPEAPTQQSADAAPAETITPEVKTTEPTEVVESETPAIMEEEVTTTADTSETNTSDETTTDTAEAEQNKSETEDTTEAEAIVLVDEPEIADPADTTATVETTPVAQQTETAEDQAKAKQEQISDLLQKAEAAIKNKQIGDDNAAPGALAFLRQVNELDKENPEAVQLINKVLDNIFNQAEQQISGNDFGKAQTNLSNGDKIIREFMVSGQLQRLVQLESKLAATQQEDVQVAELLVKAREAIQSGNLTTDDSDDDHALLHLTNLLFKQPDNPQALTLLKEIVKLRQQTAQAAIAEGELEQAGTYLGESERLIRQYQFTDLENGQQELNTAYANMIAQPAPVAEIQRSSEVEVIELQPQVPLQQGVTESADTSIIETEQPSVPAFDAFTQQASELPVETLPVNPIRIQETETVIVDEVAPVEEVLTEVIPELEATPAVMPIWESDDLGNIPAVSTPPQQAPQPQATQQRPANNNNNNNGQEIYTYQSEDAQLQAIDQQIFNDFNASPNPVGSQVPVVQQPQFQQPQLQVQSPPQPQPAQQIPEMQPLGVVPELELDLGLEEIPLSDIEEILPATN